MVLQGGHNHRVVSWGRGLHDVHGVAGVEKGRSMGGFENNSIADGVG